MKRVTITLTFLIFLNHLNANISNLVYRSEYEKVGDLIYDINEIREGFIVYSIDEGNENGHYSINSKNGEIRISSPIEDAYGVVHTDLLKVKAGVRSHEIKIVDGFDYVLSILPKSFSVLSDHKEVFIDPNSKWTVFNNLWGKGTAVPDVDFRIAMIDEQKLPGTCILISDMPGRARDFGGEPVWCYINVMWGNRSRLREDLTEFLLQIKNLNRLNFEFYWRQLYGDEKFKIAFNMFMTEQTKLSNMGKNRGDFFFILDQIDTYIPHIHILY